MYNAGDLPADITANKELHWAAISLRFIAASELNR